MDEQRGPVCFGEVPAFHVRAEVESLYESLDRRGLWPACAQNSGVGKGGRVDEGEVFDVIGRSGDGDGVHGARMLL